MGALSTRDGLVGRFDPGLIKPQTLTVLDDVGPLEKWEPWVRAEVVDVEMLSPLQYRAVGKSGYSIHWVDVDLGNLAKSKSAPIVTLHRPTSARAAMSDQVALVAGYADLREDRSAEILSQMSQLLSYWSSIVCLHPNRTRWTLELLAAGLRLAVAVEMRVKHAFAFPRPVQFSPQIQPMIQTPWHSAYPSGHATEAHMCAHLLMGIMNETATTPTGTMLLKQAGRIAINRTVAGLHFPIDSRGGQILGAGLAEYLVSRCNNTGSAHQHRTFDAGQYLKNDFIGYPTDDYVPTAAGLQVAPVAAAPQSKVMGWLWGKATSEWK